MASNSASQSRMLLRIASPGGSSTPETESARRIAASARDIGGSDSDEYEVDSSSGGAPRPCGGLFAALATNKVLASLLVCVPMGFVVHFLNCPAWIIFGTNFMAILPMAWLIGKSTEDLASVAGDALGGLLNATFGNIVEMLLCIAGIRQGEIIVVKGTLVGSILSNMLLVLGTAMMWGGVFHAAGRGGKEQQRFQEAGASIQSSLMLLAVLCLALPSVYCKLMPTSDAIVSISRSVSVLLLLMYAQYLYFQLSYAPQLFEPEKNKNADGEDEDSDDEDEVDMTPGCAGITLGVCTVLTAFCTEYLIGSIEGAMLHWNVSKDFIGIILLPIIGNAAEHYTSIIVAGRNKMDLSLGVALGSSCQMALLVTPFTVLAAWGLGKNPLTTMNLNFNSFEIMILLLSCLLVSSVLKDGESNGLSGLMLLLSYCAIAAVYWCQYPEAETAGAPVLFLRPSGAIIPSTV